MQGVLGLDDLWALEGDYHVERTNVSFQSRGLVHEMDRSPNQRPGVLGESSIAGLQEMFRHLTALGRHCDQTRRGFSVRSEVARGCTMQALFHMLVRAATGEGITRPATELALQVNRARLIDARILAALYRISIAYSAQIKCQYTSLYILIDVCIQMFTSTCVLCMHEQRLCTEVPRLDLPSRTSQH